MRQKNLEIDEIDRAIIAELQRNGRVSYKDIARKLKVSDGTIRFRTEKMIKKNLLRITASVNPFYFKNTSMALIGINIEKRDHQKIMQSLSKLRGVTSVCNLTGRYDLVVEVFFDSREELRKFLVEELNQITDINFTETYVYLDGINKWMELS